MGNTETKAPQRVRPTLVPEPKLLPARTSFVDVMLTASRRPAVPIRTSFIQRKTADADGNRGSLLGEFVKMRTDSFLDGFLFIHALASSSEPHDATYPASTWVRSLNLDKNAGTGDDTGVDAAKSSWSKITKRLVDKNLIRREKSGGMMSYILLDESGSGDPYVRPRLFATHGTWLTIPHIYWQEGHYLTLSLAAKAMLLIALDSDDNFRLPAERCQKWYGISESTARKGINELMSAGILTYTQSWRVEPKSKTGHAEVRHYRLLGEWTRAARKEAVTRTDAAKVSFQVQPAEAVSPEAAEAEAAFSPAEAVAPELKFLAGEDS